VDSYKKFIHVDRCNRVWAYVPWSKLRCVQVWNNPV